jgi:hypothetical protein
VARAEYLLPLRWADDTGLEELVRYLERLSGWIDVTVVDGSDEALFRRHAAVLPVGVRHLRPEAWPGRNGKVAGVMTGVRHARHGRVVIADDDVRYGRAELMRVLALLDNADLVRPQNYFLELKWHTRWDTARTLINRALGSDYPGTLAVRRVPLLAAGGYDGDVLFENLQLIRTIRAADGRIVDAPEVFVGRMAPTARHFWGQRVRQAYDDFGQPGRLICELSLLPLILLLARWPVALAIFACTACGVAECGRRRDGGRAVFPPTLAMWAPAWVLERAVCVWLAVGTRLRGGIRYAGVRILHAATAPAVLRDDRRSPDDQAASRHDRPVPERATTSARRL